MPDYPETGEAQIAETKLGNWRLIVRRTRLVGAQAELWPDWRYHCFATNRNVPMLTADMDHRDHATVELTIRDLKDQALAHFPSGRYAANSAWTVIAALAHNLGRWTTQIGLPTAPVQTAHSRRRQLLAIPGRLTRTSRQWTLRMPARWPWKTDFTTVLDAIRALPALSLTSPRQPPQPPANPTADTGPLTPARNQPQTFPRERRHPNTTSQTSRRPPQTPQTPTKPTRTDSLTPNPGHDHPESVAVGTAVAGRPPHRSQRAELPHWAPALGDGGESLLGPGVQDSRLR